MLALAIIWGISAVLSAWMAGRKGRGVKRWAVLGAIAGPFALVAHAFYPPRYVGETMPCPRCGKPVGLRVVACHYCQYRLPAQDVLITKLPDDPGSLRTVLEEVAREYGVTYDEARRKVAALPVAGYRHILPDQVEEYAKRLERVGAEVRVVPTAGPARSS